MNLKKISTSPLLVLLLLALPGSLRAQAVPDLTPLERTALEELTVTGTPGAAVAVIRGDRVVFSKGLGVANVETGAPVTPETVFHIGSLTKVLTAAAVVAEAEGGRLRLGAPVGEDRRAPLLRHPRGREPAGAPHIPGADGKPAYMQMFIWVFRKTE